jgi:hypothetical protein
MLVAVEIGDTATTPTPVNTEAKNVEGSELGTLMGRRREVLVSNVRDGSAAAPGLIMGRRLATRVHRTDDL